ncbi:methyltransferase domain-containing protein [Pseudomonas sp. CFBP 8771]|uniref:class I SAM-dependent methyltransferase n=1 Tax=Pseudomonas sp. CFBP 8771 TaxID=2775285 RepID=UPI00177F2EF0|nr:class I SAM-dependent methyltransferase [Pseudomonas sp. CFBP 8771]MBD8601570.1 methyltransferase domain-containing protein [Pseudomonas sp. CFBP 8771]
MDDSFYRAFEDRYRGSRDLITERLRVYLPFLDPLKDLYQDYPILDLGCGRGEWLELLQREGYAPMGVDLDEGMLQACQALGLPARNADALAALKELPDNSLVAVTGFHIAEHIPFPVLQEVVAEAQRVLRPAGLLILETPNAESLVVGTNTFYLDPTHERPLPGLLLSFLAEHSGFARAKIVRLQERSELRAEDQKIGVWDVISGTSPDYAVVAQKPAAAEQLETFASAFDIAYGVALHELAMRYDHGIEQRLSAMETKLAENPGQDPGEQYVSYPGLQDAIERIHAHHAEQLKLLHENFQHSAEVHEDRFSQEAQAQEARFAGAVLAQEERFTEALLAQEQRFQDLVIAQEQRFTDALGAQEQRIIEASFAQEQRFSQGVEAHQHRFSESVIELQQRCFHLQNSLAQAHEHHSNAVQELEQVRSELNASLGHAHHWYLRAVAYEQQLQEMQSSTFWRVTSPARWSVHTVRTAPGAAVGIVRGSGRKVLGAAVQFVLGRPMLHQRLNTALKRSPRLYMALKSVVHNHGMMPDAALASSLPSDSSVPAHLEGLSVEARQIYHDLKKAIDQKDRG